MATESPNPQVRYLVDGVRRAARSWRVLARAAQLAEADLRARPDASPEALRLLRQSMALAGVEPLP